MSPVLVVEDEPAIMEPLVHSLRDQGYSVLTADNGLDACRMIGTERPELIFLDILLPDLDGWEICSLLRQHPDPSIASTPVIMLTALSTPSDRYRGLSLGADAYLSKPYSIREVILLAGNLLKRHRQMKGLEKQLEAVINRQDQNVGLHHLLIHELRNQLMVLDGYSNLLKHNHLSQHKEQCIDAIVRSSSYLQSLAEEVLLIKQVENGLLSLERKPVTITAIIREILEIYEAPAKARNIRFIYEENGLSSPVELNAAALKIILSALLDNGLKYGPDGQIIHLTSCVDERFVQINVTDQGPGIASELQERIFEPFYRPGQASKVKGSGLGLYAVRTLSKAMGGDVNLVSMPGEGCCFQITLPV